MWRVLTKWVVCQWTWFREKHAPHKHATMNFDDFDFVSPKYTLVSFLSIGYAYRYFSFILLFSTRYSFLDTLRNISRMNLVKQNR